LPDGFPLELAATNTLISRKDNPIPLTAGAQPNSILSTEWECLTRVPYVRATLAHSRYERARIDRLVDVENRLLKPLRGG
jgi:hypothetical protein